MEKRLHYLDMAKGIGILLVLIGHLQGDQIFSFSPYIYPFCVFIFSFHMPLFFIISGILMAIKNEENKPFKSIAVNRFKGIMIPYYWFSFFYLLVVITALVKGGIAPKTLFVNIWYVLGLYGMNVLWFLPALFMGELLFIWLRKKYTDDRIFAAVVFVLFLIVFVIAYLLTQYKNDWEVYIHIKEFLVTVLRPFIAMGFIAIGYFARRLYEKNSIVNKWLTTTDREGKKNNASIAFCLIAGIVLMAVCFIFSKVNNGIDIRSMVLRNFFFFMLCALSGSFGLILFCKGLPRLKLLCYWGTGSLIFMATHNSETVLYLAQKLAMYVNQYLTRARGYICYAIIITVIAAYSTLMIFLIKKYAPFIIGRKYGYYQEKCNTNTYN